MDITETRQQIQRCEFKDELRFIAGFEEKDKDEFYKEVDGQKYKEAIRKQPGPTMMFFRNVLFFFLGPLFS